MLLYKLCGLSSGSELVIKNFDLVFLLPKGAVSCGSGLDLSTVEVSDKNGSIVLFNFPFGTIGGFLLRLDLTLTNVGFLFWLLSRSVSSNGCTVDTREE